MGARKIMFDLPSGKQAWGWQSAWTRGRVSERMKKLDGVRMFTAPTGGDLRSLVTVRVVGIPSTRSREEVVENLEQMAGDYGRIQAV